MLDLSPELDSLWDELNEAIQGVLRSGRFILGPDVAAFEQEVASYLGTRHAIGVNSGTDALVIGLRALGIGAGDEVITTPFTFFATAEAITQVGATPVFVDIDPETLNIDPAQVAAHVTERTRAVLPVHLFGHAVDMDALQGVAAEHGLKVVEDVAQAFGGDFRGRKVGTLGDVGAYSFFPSKNLGAYGDGGLITTDDDAVAEGARMLRAHGARRKYHNEAIGYNSRLDTLQAAILRVKLPHLDESNAGRRRVAERYREGLELIPGVTPAVEADYARHVYHQYTIRIDGGRRDAVAAQLEAAGIQSMIFYPTPLYRLPPYAHMGVTLTECERAAAEVLSLPIWPGMTEAVQDRIIDEIRQALA
jgi:dTDP-4-amino-4,6-dideoxygalactose transaminase